MQGKYDVTRIERPRLQLSKLQKINIFRNGRRPGTHRSFKTNVADRTDIDRIPIIDWQGEPKESQIVISAKYIVLLYYICI